MRDHGPNLPLEHGRIGPDEIDPVVSALVLQVSAVVDADCNDVTVGDRACAVLSDDADVERIELDRESRRL
jgi:hypothetical protein